MYDSRQDQTARVVLQRDKVCRDCKRQPATAVVYTVPPDRGGHTDPSCMKGVCEWCKRKSTVRVGWR